MRISGKETGWLDELPICSDGETCCEMNAASSARRRETAEPGQCCINSVKLHICAEGTAVDKRFARPHHRSEVQTH